MRPEPDPKRRDPFPERTQIWTEGRQQPRFKAGAFWRVGVAMARIWLVPLLDRAALGLSGLSREIAAGRFRVRVAWMGRAARFVPSRLSVAALVAGFAARVSEARTILKPLPVTAPPQPVRLRPQVKATGSTDLSLAAIRAAIRSVEAPEAAPPPPPAPSSPAWRTMLTQGAAHALAWTSLALALPVGLTQALIYHIDGGDLADWT